VFRFRVFRVVMLLELIAKPPALPETRASDAHFSGIAYWRAMFPGGFAITFVNSVKVWLSEQHGDMANANTQTPHNNPPVPAEDEKRAALKPTGIT